MQNDFKNILCEISSTEELSRGSRESDPSLVHNGIQKADKRYRFGGRVLARDMEVVLRVLHRVAGLLGGEGGWWVCVQQSRSFRSFRFFELPP